MKLSRRSFMKANAVAAAAAAAGLSVPGVSFHKATTTEFHGVSSPCSSCW